MKVMECIDEILGDLIELNGARDFWRRLHGDFSMNVFKPCMVKALRANGIAVPVFYVTEFNRYGFLLEDRKALDFYVTGTGFEIARTIVQCAEGLAEALNTVVSETFGTAETVGTPTAGRKFRAESSFSLDGHLRIRIIK